MEKLPPLPKSELEIARIVWDRGRVTVRDVVNALPEDRALDFFTVQTYLRRLADKGYLNVEKEGRANVYAPRVQPKRVVQQMIEDFIRRVFDGEALPLMQHLIQREKLSDAELKSLQATLDKLKENRP